MKKDKLTLENQIWKLENNTKDNARIVSKLKRQLRLAEKREAR